VVLVQVDRAAAPLTQHHVELAGVAEVAGHDAAAVAVVVRPAHAADVQKISLAVRTLDVEVDALALVGAEVVALIHEVERVVHPPFLQAGIHFARDVYARRAVARL